MKKKNQDLWIPQHVSRYLLFITCCLIAPSHETYYKDPAHIASLLSSLPTIIKQNGESKITRRSPLNLGYVVGIGNHHEATLSHGVSKLSHLMSRVQAPSISPSLAHTLISHATKPVLSHPSKYVAHDLTVTQPTSHHSIMKVVSVGTGAPGRDLNHGPVSGLEHVTHALVPTITHVTTTTVSEHGVTNSPTVTLLDHSLVPVTALTQKSSHGLSKQSTVTLTPEYLTKTTITVNHGAMTHNHILATVTEHKDPLLHTVVHKVSTLTHDPDPILTHDVSVTHITDGVVLAPIVTHKPPQPPVHHSVYRTHYGGFGVGVDFGGHGGGHGFYV